LILHACFGTQISFHGRKIIDSHLLLPIGELSEEVQEACNKNFKQFKESTLENIKCRDDNK